MHVVTRSPTARRDLSGIWDFIARDNPTAADKLLSEIDSKCQMLAGNPQLGEQWPELGDGIRFFTIRKTWVILYRSTTTGIDLVRVLHGSRDIPSLF